MRQNNHTQSQTPQLDWHAIDEARLIATLDADPHQGLSLNEAAQRLSVYGKNSINSTPSRPAWLRFLLQFHNLLIYVLMGAMFVTFYLQHYIDSGVIAGVIIINAIIGYIQEGKAEQALEAVRSMLAQHATVIRDGSRHTIDAAQLVPGDLVLLESGDKVPADLRLIQCKNLRLEEAALTGESVPVEKSPDQVDVKAGIGDRTCMAFSGTLVTFGNGRGIVASTGIQTEIGKIGQLVGQVSGLTTPLTRRLDQFARQITVFILAVGFFTFLYGRFVAQMPPLDIFLAVVGLSVAAIPEGLPAIVTIVLAIGTRNMAKNNAIIRRLPAVETLGSVSVICSDKTGTLTKNEMTAVRLVLVEQQIKVSGAGYRPEGGFSIDGQIIIASEHAALVNLLQCALLCNDAQLKYDTWELNGDPTEGALISLAYKAQFEPQQLHQQFPRVDEIPFESERRYMATLHHDHAGHSFILLKGAPEQILALCKTQANQAPLDLDFWLAQIKQAAQSGERVLAFARCQLENTQTSLDEQDISIRFELLGLVGIIDPPREEAVAAILECQKAGIRVKMITGDHVETAAAIGRQLGLHTHKTLSGQEIEAMDDDNLRLYVQDTDIIARASPVHKLRLISALQWHGHSVAMTGDGANDAPALKAADIGVAMGQKGTDAAREASDLVLTDDNFATITRAVREGRVVFDNIKKSLMFILPTNGGQAGIILFAVFTGLVLPITAGQILWVNMITAVTLALALAFESGEEGLMANPPRETCQPLITLPLATRILFVSILMICVTLTVFQWELGRGSSLEVARTSAVNMLVAGELAYLFNVRHFTRSSFNLETLTGNPVALWVSGCLIVFQLLFTYAPPFQQIFQTAGLGLSSWIPILILAAGLFLIVEIEKACWRHFKIFRM